MNNQEANDKQDSDLLWKEMREESGQNAEGNAAAKEKSPFQIIPDGNYNARVEIVKENVSTENSPNYGRPKYTVKLTIIEGDLKGKMAYINRVIHPYNLANKPAEKDTAALQKWSADVKAWMRKTDEILKKCGVDYSGSDMNRYTKEIAANNRRNPIVNFSMKGGNAYINNLVKKEPAQDADELFNIPDGNDLPIN